MAIVGMAVFVVVVEFHLLLLNDCTEGERAELCANLTAMKDNRRKFHS